MRNTPTCRMLFGFGPIAAINRQWVVMSRWNCLKGMWMILSARYVVSRLQFTLEKVNMEGDLVFLDINTNVSSNSNISCHLYQERSDTGIILNFGSCAPLQGKQNVIQGTVRMIFNAISNWLAFDQALEKNKTCWTKNQYPEERSSKTVNQNLEKIMSGGRDQLITTPKEHQKIKTRSHDKTTIFLQYRGNLTQILQANSAKC